MTTTSARESEDGPQIDGPQIEVTPDVAYRDPLAAGDTNNTLDIYSGRNDRGAIVNIHGGGWFKGTKAQDRELALSYCQAGYLVFVPDYRLAPEALFPAQIEDVMTCIAWVRESGYDFDRARLAITGSSAGGNLSVEAGLRTGLPCVSWSGLIDLDGFLSRTEDVVPHKTEQHPEAASTEIDQGGRDDPFYKWCILNLLGQDPTLAAAATPIHRVDAATGPMFLANALTEFIPPDEVMTLQRALTAHNVPSVVKLVEGSAHAKGYQSQVWTETLSFLDRYLARGNPPSDAHRQEGGDNAPTGNPPR